MKTAFRGAQSAFVCEGECATSCPADYYHEFRGDAYCSENKRGTRCCLPLKMGPGAFVRSGDIKLYYNNDKKHPLRDGAVVQLRPTKKQSSFSFDGRFSLSFTNDAKYHKCYWQASIDGGEAINYVGSVKAPFQQLFENAEGAARGAGNTPKLSDLQDCKAYAGDSTLSIPLEKAFTLLGKRIDFTLVVVDEKSCNKKADGNPDPQASVDSCDTHTLTVSVEVPDRNPVLSLLLGKTPASRTQPNELRVGESQQLTARFKEQYAYCSIKLAPEIGGFRQDDLGAEPYSTLAAIQTGKQHDGTPVPCFQLKPWEERIDLNLPEDVARNIPFSIILRTSFSKERDPQETTAKSPLKPDVVVRYPFRIAPDPHLTVTGPSPGLTRQKTIDIACQDVTCTGFAVTYLDNPLECRARGASPDSYSPIPELEKYGGEKEARWRFTLKDEDENGKYVCVKATTNQGAIYSLGLSNGLPTPVSIDATPPDLALSFTLGDSFINVLKMRCSDPTGPSGEEYTSGCKDRPYSYAYVTDPLSFATRIITGSSGSFLSGDWHGCPDPYTGYWITYNSDKDEMEYLDNAVKVICIRAQDAAGNSVVKSKLLYSTQEMVALFLRELAKQGVI